MVAITNGNARPELFGLSDYFRFVLRAGPDGRSKPFADMYHLAAERLNVPLGRFCTSAMIRPPTWPALFAVGCRPAGLNCKART